MMEHLTRYAMVGDLNDRHMDAAPDGPYLLRSDVLAEARASQPPTLDVERVERAMANVRAGTAKVDYPDWYEAVAAEYAALACDTDT